MEIDHSEFRINSWTSFNCPNYLPTADFLTHLLVHKILRHNAEILNNYLCGSNRINL